MTKMFTENFPFVLASGSPRRKEILSVAGFDFKIISAEIDEKPNSGESDSDYPIRMACEKAGKVSAGNPGNLVIGADTIVSHRGDILGKPSNAGHALEMLTQLKADSHRVITAVSAFLDGKELRVFSETTEVDFYDFDSKILKRYADSGEPMGKAGSYAIQGIGAFLIRTIRGSFHNVVGFPIEKFIQVGLEESWLT